MNTQLMNARIEQIKEQLANMSYGCPEASAQQYNDLTHELSELEQIMDIERTIKHSEDIWINNDEY